MIIKKLLYLQFAWLRLRYLLVKPLNTGHKNGIYYIENILHIVQVGTTNENVTKNNRINSILVFFYVVNS